MSENVTTPTTTTTTTTTAPPAPSFLQQLETGLFGAGEAALEGALSPAAGQTAIQGAESAAFASLGQTAASAVTTLAASSPQAQAYVAAGVGLIQTIATHPTPAAAGAAIGNAFLSLFSAGIIKF